MKTSLSPGVAVVIIIIVVLIVVAVGWKLTSGKKASSTDEPAPDPSMTEPAEMQPGVTGDTGVQSTDVGQQESTESL